MVGFSSTTVTAALLLFSGACAAVDEAAHRLRTVKIYSSATIRREESGVGVVDPFLGLPDEREQRRLQVPVESSMSMSMSASVSFSYPVVPVTTTVAPASTEPATTTATTTTEATTTTTDFVFCTEQYDPVCGEDGTTYSNDCKAGVANVAIAYKGECVKPTTTVAPEEFSVLPIMPEADEDLTTTGSTTSTLSETPEDGLNFELPRASEGAPSSAMMMDQSAVLFGTAVCAVAGVVALM